MLAVLKGHDKGETFADAPYLAATILRSCIDRQRNAKTGCLFFDYTEKLTWLALFVLCIWLPNKASLVLSRREDPAQIG